MTELSQAETDALLAESWPPPDAPDPVPTPRRCIHRWLQYSGNVDETRNGLPYYSPVETRCSRCGVVRDEVRARRGKQSRNYGNRAELAVSRKYGGTKVGHAGGPVDVRGKDFNTQVKTHRRTPPREWVGVFNALEANRERCPRLLLRFVMGSGVPPRDYFVFQADDFLDWFGRDEELA